MLKEMLAYRAPGKAFPGHVHKAAAANPAAGSQTTSGTVNVN